MTRHPTKTAGAKAPRTDDCRTGAVTGTIWPREIVLNRAERVLRVDFEDGSSFALPAEYLRVESPSAEVRGHSAAERRTVGGKRLVGISAVEPVGNYAARLIFDDGHATGIYSWSYLYELGRERETRWAVYLADLTAKGLRRDA
jgi:DUF971 family protein